MQLRKETKKDLFKAFFLMMAIIGVIVMGNGIGRTYSEDAGSDSKIPFFKDPNDILKSVEVKKIAGSIDQNEEKIRQQLDGLFGQSAGNFLQELSSTDAIIRARNTLLGQYDPGQFTNTILETVSGITALTSQLTVENYYSSAASNSSLNAQFMDNQTKNIMDQLQNINSLKSKLNGLIDQIKNEVDKASSLLPALAPQ